MSSQKEYAAQAPGATGVDPQHPARQMFRVVDHDHALLEPLDGVHRKKIAIVGFAASSRNLAPFDDPSYIIAGLNQLYRHIPRADVWFDIHANWREDNVEGTDHEGYLRQCGMPVFMSTREASIPTAVNFPLQRVIDRVAGCDYFTSTVAFMLGWAILQHDEQVDRDIEALHKRIDAGDGDAVAIGRDPRKLLAWTKDRYSECEIAIFGIDLIVGTEYDFQKACVEYMLGLANARGITVRIPPQSALLKQRWRYGYETEPQAWPIKMSELSNRGAALDNERNNLIARLQTIDGARQEQAYWSQVADLRMKNGTIRLNEESS